MNQAQIGIIGLGTMGRNLALNLTSKGIYVAVYNRTSARTVDFEAENKGGSFTAALTLDDFIDALSSPKKILLMVTPGEAVDKFIELLETKLSRGDVIIDGGNSHFKDTARRAEKLEREKGVFYLGLGVSGGEEGARNGPSLMAGGHPQAWDATKDILSQIAARTEGEPCCAYFGEGGAGHFVKMVHNGIEYAEMQLIADIYLFMRDAMAMAPAEMSEIFSRWNKGPLESYLTEITANILAAKDTETGVPMVDVILDRASQKGTGAWTAESALELAVPIPTIAEAIFSRFISAAKDERVEASKLLRGPRRTWRGNRNEFLFALEDALYGSKICAFTQGFHLLAAASVKYGWGINLAEVASVWRDGCIIRARLLEDIRSAYKTKKPPANLMLSRPIKSALRKAQTGWRKIVIESARLGLPCPAIFSALSYYDSVRRERSGANLIAAQRDYFGAHQFEKINQQGLIHFDWGQGEPS